MVLRSERGNIRLGVEVVGETKYQVVDGIFEEGKFDFQCIPASFYAGPHDSSCGSGVSSTVSAADEFQPFTFTDYAYDSYKWKQHVVQKLSPELLVALYRVCSMYEEDSTEPDITSRDAQRAMFHILALLEKELSWGFHCTCTAILIPLAFLAAHGGEETSEASNEADIRRQDLGDKAGEPTKSPSLLPGARYVATPVSVGSTTASPRTQVPQTICTSFLQQLGGLLRRYSCRDYGPRLAIEVCAFNHDGTSALPIWRQLQALAGVELGCCLRYVPLNVFKTSIGSAAIETALQSWVGYTPDCISLPRSVFLANKTVCPVLPVLYKQLTQKLMETGAQVTISVDQPSLMTNPTFADIPGFLGKVRAYLLALWQGMPPLTESQLIRLEYRDVLQTPLQPLKDNLEAETYESFESDPVKYELYEKAFRLCLEKMIAATADARSKQEPVVLTVAYCGGGRGPLMSRFFMAMTGLGIVDPASPDKTNGDTLGGIYWSTTPGLGFKFYVVEKNSNAAATLRYRIRFDPQRLWRHVTLVEKDMRDWAPETSIDILISELLGSCGDNELSPECLDMVQKHLSPSGVSIPCSYTSYMEPVMSLKNWKTACLDVKNLESHYIVDLFAFVPIAREREKPAFTFVHPNPELVGQSDGLIRKNKHNERYASIKWVASQDAVLHGFAGYFSATLIEGVECSIAPHNHSPMMDSWFPVFVPLMSPFAVMAGETISMNLWRRCADGKVWYEWSTSHPRLSIIHNSGGKSMAIGS